MPDDTTPKAQAEPLTDERTQQDYAIEHAEYMAKDADQLLQAIEALSAAEAKREEADDDTPELEGAVHDARDVVWERVRGLREGVYEFRKRRGRALSQQPADEALLRQAMNNRKDAW